MACVRAGCVAIGILIASAGFAQTPAPTPTPSGAGTAATQAPAARPQAGNVVARTPLPRNRIPPRTFQQCNQDALARHYRGAERRHYVARCQLGVRRLFRRRGRNSAAAAQPPVPVAQPPSR